MASYLFLRKPSGYAQHYRSVYEKPPLLLKIAAPKESHLLPIVWNVAERITRVNDGSGVLRDHAVGKRAVRR